MSTWKYQTTNLNGNKYPGEWIFRNPTVTISNMPVLNPRTMERMGTRRVYTIRGLFITTQQENFTLKLEQMKKILHQPGGTLTQLDDVGRIIQEASNAKDAKRGPIPSPVEITKMYGLNCADFVWQLETYVTRQTGDILYDGDLVYTISSSIDQSMITTRTITGVFTLWSNSDKVQNNFSGTTFKGADCYRQDIEKGICEIPECWQRLGATFTMSEDGLSVAFTVVDQQRFAMLPLGCVNGDVTLVMDHNLSDGPLHSYSLDGFYESGPDNPIAPFWAFNDLVNGLWKDQQHGPGTPLSGIVLKGLRLSKNLYKPSLAFSVSWEVFADFDRIGGDTTEVKSTNFMLALVAQSDNWLKKYKSGGGGPTFYEFPFKGTTEVVGWCGKGQHYAPALKLPSMFGGYLGKSTSGNIVDASGGNAAIGDQSNIEKRYSIYHQNFTWKTDMGVTVHPVMSSSGDDIVQHTRNPQMWLIITGDAKRAHVVPTIPECPITADKGDIIWRRCSNGSPTPGPVYTSSWNYIVKLKSRIMPTYVNMPYTPFVTENVNNKPVQILPLLKSG